MKFFDYILVAGGQISRREYDSADCLRLSVETCRDMLLSHGHHFRHPVPGLEDYYLEWFTVPSGTAVATCDLATVTFWAGPREPVRTSLLLPGQDLVAERNLLRRFQQELVNRYYTRTRTEPSFDALSIAERPAILSLLLPGAVFVSTRRLFVIANLETVLAAAFFEQRLA